jgi:tryptophanyl-tRNA synthetase
MKAVTDNDSVVAFDRVNKAGISNLLAIFSAVTGQKIEKIASEYSDKGYGVFKSAVADAVIAYLEPFQAKMSQFLEDKGQLRIILDDGAAKAYELSHPKTLEIAAKIGLYVHA